MHYFYLVGYLQDITGTLFVKIECAVNSLEVKIALAISLELAST